MTCSQMREIAARSRKASVTELVFAGRHYDSCKACQEYVEFKARNQQRKLTQEQDDLILLEALNKQQEINYAQMIDPELKE